MSFEPVSGSDLYGKKRIPLGGEPLGGEPLGGGKPALPAGKGQEQKRAA